MPIIQIQGVLFGVGSSMPFDQPTDFINHSTMEKQLSLDIK
jgi:hypothetical protein